MGMCNDIYTYNNATVVWLGHAIRSFMKVYHDIENVVLHV